MAVPDGSVRGTIRSQRLVAGRIVAGRIVADRSRPARVATIGAEILLQALAQVGGEAVVVEQGVVDIEQEYHAIFPGFCHTLCDSPRQHGGDASSIVWGSSKIAIGGRFSWTINCVVLGDELFLFDRLVQEHGTGEEDELLDLEAAL